MNKTLIIYYICCFIWGVGFSVWGNMKGWPFWRIALGASVGAAIAGLIILL